MTELLQLDIHLNKAFVGTLLRLSNGRVTFYFDEKYLLDPNRPTLSQSFLNKTGDLIQNTRSIQSRAPTYFSNLLPEGHLRDYLVSNANIKTSNELALLQLLGEDLPGAVLITPSEEMRSLHNDEFELVEAEKHDEQILKFSLAGVQLKFSALMEAQGGLTIPAHGIGGDWIVKLPSATFADVPENEYSMLYLANLIGIKTPEINLLEVKNIQGLPELPGSLKGNALIVKRFDRENNKRIHTEDFAQVYGVYPQKKYQGVSYNNIARMLAQILGDAGLEDFIQRLAFNLLIGNGDMHLKNWSLIYPDGRTPRLAPAYDFVSTQVYMPGEKMGLSMSGEKEMTKIDADAFKRFARKSDVSERLVLDTVNKTVALTHDAWQREKMSLPLPKAMRASIDKHLIMMLSLLR